MMRSTHQVAAFAAALGALSAVQPVLAGPPPGSEPDALAVLVAAALGLPATEIGVPWPAAIVFVLVAILGGMAPDLDRSDSLWARLLSATALGGHRHLSHSLLGAGLATGLVCAALALLSPLVSFPVGLLWLGFLAGYLSHLAMDALTHDGVPFLFPWDVRLGLPPWPESRIRTGGWAEQFLVMPGLLTLIAWVGFRQGALLAAIWRWSL